MSCMNAFAGYIKKQVLFPLGTNNKICLICLPLWGKLDFSMQCPMTYLSYKCLYDLCTLQVFERATEELQRPNLKRNSSKFLIPCNGYPSDHYTVVLILTTRGSPFTSSLCWTVMCFPKQNSWIPKDSFHKTTTSVILARLHISSRWSLGWTRAKWHSCTAACVPGS